MLDAFPAACDEHSRAREEAVRPTGWFDEAGVGSRAGIERQGREAVVALFRHRAESAAIARRPRQGRPREVEHADYGGDQEAGRGVIVPNYWSTKISGRNLPINRFGNLWSMEPATGFSKATWPSANVTFAFW